VIKSLRHEALSGLTFEVDVFNKGTSLKFDCLVFQLNRITRENITAKDVLHTQIFLFRFQVERGTYNWNFWLLIHRDRFNFPAELFRSIRQHHVQVVCKQDFPVVDIAELINPLTNLNLL
jgi:hypothetical protein